LQSVLHVTTSPAYGETHVETRAPVASLYTHEQQHGCSGQADKHLQVVGSRVCPDWQPGTQLPPQSVVPLGHWHTPPTHSCPSAQHSVPHVVVPLGQPPWHTPRTHSCPAAQLLEQLPQWRSLVLRFTHPSLQRVLPSGQPQTLSSPRLTQFLEQHWRSLRHLRPKPLQSSSAKAVPGTEANAPPTRAAPISLSALPLERVPLANPLVSSSKALSVVCVAIGCPP